MGHHALQTQQTNKHSKMQINIHARQEAAVPVSEGCKIVRMVFS
jgi:hypothetical protein